MRNLRDTNNVMGFIKVFMHPNYQSQVHNDNDLAILEFVKIVMEFDGMNVNPKSALPVCVPQISNYMCTALLRTIFVCTKTRKKLLAG